MYNQDLAYIHASWGNLNAYRIPGTPRPLRPLEPWVKKQPTTSTKSKAPLHLDTLEIMLDIQIEAYAHLDEAGVTYNPKPPAFLKDLDTVLRITAKHAGAWHQGITDWAHIKAQHVRNHLEHTYDGQTIRATCPSCGDYETLRIRTVHLAGRHEPYLTCESGHCNPPEHICTTWIGGRPVWKMDQWEWFAHLISKRTK